MFEVDLLRRAKINLWNANLIMKQLQEDSQLDLAAYHIQQAVEKMMKFELNEIGASFAFTHDIDVLIQHFDDAGLVPCDWIVTEAATLTNYATKTAMAKT